MGYIYDENLDSQIVVRLLPADKEWLKARARELRSSAGSIIRDAIRSERIAVELRKSSAA